MNEDIKKNAEINDDELEQVAGGGCYYEENVPDCPNCGTKMSFGGNAFQYWHYCDSCGYRIDYEP